MENKDFDKYLKDSLENLSERFDQGSWELLQQKMMLDPDFGMDQSENVDFDDNIREKLEGIEGQYDPTHWDAMESHLDKIQLESTVDDIEFDNIVRENLNDLQIPYNHAHWTLMSNRLDEEFSLRRKLYKYKVAEVTLMLLAIFTLFQYLPLHKINANKTQTEQPVSVETLKMTPSERNTSSVSSSNEAKSVNDERIIAQTQIENHQEAVIDAISPNQGTSPKTNIANIEAIANTSTGFITEKAFILADKSLETLVNSFSTKAQANSIKQEPSAVDATNTTTAVATTIDSSSDLVDEKTGFKPANLGLLALSTLRMDIPENKLIPPPSFCGSCHPKKAVSIRLGMFFSSDINEILTPRETAKYDEFDRQFTLGYGGGITLGFKHRKWEIETGISYARVSYQPIQQTIYRTGSALADPADPENGILQNNVFDAAFLNILKIPINVHYTFNHIGKWHLYATGGASINFLALNHFNITTTPVGDNTVGGVRSPEGNNGLRSPEYDGLFEGGNFQTNSYYTANLGMGIERYLNAQWSIFMQPTYQYMIFKKGFGPDQDRFNSFSIQIGAKSTFK